MSKKLGMILKKLTMAAVAIAMVFTVMSPAFVKAAVKAPTLNATEATIVVGKSFNFNIKGKVKGATYEWTANNDEVVRINKANGVVTGVGEGKTQISCRMKTGNKTYRLTAKVTVLKPAVRVAITNKVDSLNVKDYYKLKVTLTPASSTDIVTWASSNEDVAKVDTDGSFVIRKEGTVTISATTISGRSDSVTIQIGDGAVEDTEKPSEDGGADDVTKPEDIPEDKPEDKQEEVKVLKTVLDENFTTNTGLFTGRGDASAIHTTAGRDAEGGKGYVSVSGRTANWHGVIADLTELIVPGATYQVSAWVRYTSGEDIEVIKATQEAVDIEGTNYLGITGDVEVNKGKWTKISGIMEVAPGTTKCMVYFEANNLIDFYVDNVMIEQLDVSVKEEVVEEIEKAKAGDIVYKNDFEGDRILDARVGSERSITSEYSKNGASGLQVTRTAGWDGAGVKFISANDIKIKSLYGSTVHVSAYVMYMDGPDEVNFKLNNRMELVEDSDNILTQIAVKKGEWTLIEADCNVADGTAGNMVFIETDNDGALTFYMDDVEIKVVK